MWTYSGNPGFSLKDQVRFIIQDTQENDQLLLDGEITWLLSQYGNDCYQTSIRACEMIMTKFARLCDESVGQVKITYSQKVEAYTKMQAMLRERLAIENTGVFAGGIYKVDKMTNRQDRGLVKPDFTKKQMENHQIGPAVNTGGGRFGYEED